MEHVAVIPTAASHRNESTTERVGEVGLLRTAATLEFAARFQFSPSDSSVALQRV